MLYEVITKPSFEVLGKPAEAAQQPSALGGVDDLQAGEGRRRLAGGGRGGSVPGRTPGGGDAFRTRCVITSYSIHYTKLYESANTVPDPDAGHPRSTGPASKGHA